MEVAADLMLFVKDVRHYEVLQARQNATVISVINRAKGAKKLMPAVSRALKNKETGSKLEAAHKIALKNRNQPAERPFIETISQAGLSEDHYRYLCSFSHHNITALRIRFKPTAGDSGGVGRVSEELLALLIAQTVKNMAGPLMVLTEKAALAKQRTEKQVTPSEGSLFLSDQD